MRTIIIGQELGKEGRHSDAEAYDEVLRLNERLKTENEAERPLVYLLLQDRKLARMLNTRTFADDVHQQMDLIVSTLEDMWAQSLFVTNVMDKEYRGLDYENIGYEDDKTVHLVIFGKNAQAVALAETAALVAHYPNYLRDHSKRTRITFVADGIREFMTDFIAEHASLMDNSYYRYVNVADESVVTSHPIYEGVREDFVDIEWEFVDADFSNQFVQIKLKYWAETESQLLSVVLCNNDNTGNVSDALALNRMIGEHSIPIYVKTKRDAVYQRLLHPEYDRNITLFGGDPDALPTINHKLLVAAKYVNFIYDFCYTRDGRIPTSINRAEADSKWLNVKSAIKRTSNFSNAMTIGTKMHTLGHREEDWQNFYAITSQDLEVLSQIEHNRWSVEQLLHGFRPCTAEEQMCIEHDIDMKEQLKKRLVHFDLRAYNDLRKDRTGQNVNIYDRCLTECIPLIANLIWKEDNHE